MNGNSSESYELGPVAPMSMIDAPSAPAAPPAGNPLKRVLGALRGRIWLAVILAVLGAAAGSMVGWKVLPPSYQSTGILQFRSSEAVSLETQGNPAAMQGFEGWVELQIGLLTSDEVINTALQDPHWRALGRGRSSADKAIMLANTTTAHNKNSQEVDIQYADTSPAAAEAGCNALVAAFQSMFDEQEEKGNDEKMQALTDHQKFVENELKTKTNAMADIIKQYGTDDLSKLTQDALGEQGRIYSEINQAEVELNITHVAHPTSMPQELSDNQAAAMTGEGSRLLMQRVELQSKLTELQTSLGPEHPTVQGIRSQLDSIDGQIASIAADTRSRMESSGGIVPERATGQEPNAKTVPQLQAELETLQKQFADASTKVQKLGDVAATVQTLHADINEFQKDLENTRNKVQEVQVQLSAGGHLSVLSSGNLPVTPLKDRRIPMAIGGGLGLAFLGVGLILAIGLLDRRIRYIGDVNESPNARILGVLPYLKDPLAEPEQAAMAAHAVHQIRTQLQRRRASSDKAVITITSPAPGAGKTSLSVALGLSFAAGGSRTLMVDCDMVGGGLTRKIRRMAGNATANALTDMSGSGQQDTDAPADGPRNGRAGLLEAMNGEPIEHCVVEGGTPRLWVMPLGSAERRHAAQLTYIALRRLVDRLRDCYDVIILDTGPILASLEGPVAAMVADEVVLTAARGQHQPLVQEAIDFLQDNGANLTGIVINRAKGSDVLAYSHSSSTSRRSSGTSTMAVRPLHPIEPGCLVLDPVASAVMSTTDCGSGSGTQAA